jgi:hypothetical protein
MKIPKDNLTPEQKRTKYFQIFALIVIICGFFYYVKSDNENRDKLLNKNTETTVGKIIGNSTYKTTHNYVEYKVEGKKFETRRSSSRIFNIGEFYEIKYSKSNPEVSEVNYTKPVIFDRNEFEQIIGIISKTYENERLSVLSFRYNYKNKEHERDIILEKIGKIKEGNKIKILVNKKKPKISYLEKQFKAE